MLLAVAMVAQLGAQDPAQLEFLREESGEELGLRRAGILVYADVVRPEPIEMIRIRLRDESPEDGAGGAAFFLEELVVTDSEGQRLSNRQPLDGDLLGFRPPIEGGFLREGFLAADGEETITLIYDVLSSDFQTAIAQLSGELVRFELTLLLANDFAVDLLIDERVVGTLGSPGNVMDGSNLQGIRLGVRVGSATAVEAISWGRGKRLTEPPTD
jgi:hypothetical protein